MSCCNNIYDLGCFSACSTVDIMTATADDTYTVNATAFGPVIATTDTVTSGNPIQADNSELIYQPGYTYVLTIKDSNGDEVTDTINSVEYNCFKITFEDTLT